MSEKVSPRVIVPARSAGKSRLDSRQDLGNLPPRLAEDLTGAEDEHSRVPQVPPVAGETGSLVLVGFLLESVDPKAGPDRLSLLDIAVSGLGSARLDTERDQGTVAGQCDCLAHSVAKCRAVGDDMVRRENHEDIVGIRDQGGCHHRRRSVPPRWLDQDRGRLDRFAGQRSLHCKKLIAASHHRDGPRPGRARPPAPASPRTEAHREAREIVWGRSWSIEAKDECRIRRRGSQAGPWDSPGEGTPCG